MKTQTLIFTIAAAALTCLLAFSSNALAARKTCDDGSYPPCRDTGEEGAGNRLSVPAITFSSENPDITAYWNVIAEEDAELGTHYSYGCDKGEKDGVYSYPNTSCVDILMLPNIYYNAEECVAPGAPCEGLPVSRIYWQKIEANEWSADQDNIALSDPPSADAAYIDWGDALEAVSWTTRSKIRVETQPYTNLAPPEIFYPAVDENGDPIFALDENGDPTDIQLTTLGACADYVDPADCRVGFQMWHVSGQGITEHWGVRATEDGTSYNYDSPFQIINTPTARLNIAKMEAGTAVCRSPGEGGEGDDPPTVGPWTGSGWDGTCTMHDANYSVELSVGGKYVYGYNLDMNAINTEEECGAGWLKTGFWRLTFYTPGAVKFTDADIPKSAPPAVPAEVRDLDDFAYNTATANFLPATGELYIPVVDVENNLTYLDICIVAKDQGGGGGSGGGGGTGGGKPGDTPGAGGGTGKGGGRGK